MWYVSDNMTTKICTKCSIGKDTTLFNKENGGKMGIREDAKYAVMIINNSY